MKHTTAIAISGIIVLILVGAVTALSPQENLPLSTIRAIAETEASSIKSIADPDECSKIDGVPYTYSS